MQEKFGRQGQRIFTPTGVQGAQHLSQEEFRRLRGKLNSLLVGANYTPRIYDEQAVAFYKKGWFFTPETPLRQEPVMLETLRAKCYTETSEPDLLGLKVILRGTGEIQTRIRELLRVQEPTPNATRAEYLYTADIDDSQVN